MRAAGDDALAYAAQAGADDFFSPGGRPVGSVPVRAEGGARSDWPRSNNEASQVCSEVMMDPF